MPTTQSNNTHVIDVRPFACPLPLVKVSNYMNTLKVGDILKVSARGDEFIKDVVALCGRTGDQLIEQIKDNNELTFYIRKS